MKRLPSRCRVLPVAQRPNQQFHPIGRGRIVRAGTRPQPGQPRKRQAPHVVSTNVRGRDVGSFVAEAEQGLAQIKIPTGYWTSWGGTF